ncbi:segregation/condensation protein A [Aerococcaceae bacterium NML191292]|nr:segregation/condensation protein A [Aerococcaceae bacterium NML210727]MCW6655226.1 segregation/condensation protein A [Aerococcaceae bacterium NML201296]MCW6659627.1 segregation/condensation protein A [Aerococcaceae bacterium NML191292]MCW6662181.1 segregation/condensation protein A [Aerococcaceae bacterium NML201209]MCW6663220.1 segregation/condensation protein A [Aerococcaceae bacterium NML190073]MCW6667277.1 segregation/condensation protein A [Aerococcaceae bacterium NML190938]
MSVDKTLKLELEAFQGPFDLLLHLIKQMKVDINDIPMREITAQYMVYLRAMQQLELDIVGDYLVMAATLVEIKSRLLLPIEPNGELEDDYEPGDPRQILVQQLLLYQQFQDISSVLETKQEARSRLFSRPSEDLSDYQSFIPLEEGALTTVDLAQTMFLVLQKELQRAPKEKEIHHDPMTVSQKMDSILDVLQDSTRRIAFSELIEYGTRHEIITTFMAVLELVRKQVVVFYQEKAMDPIEIQRSKGGAMLEFN